MRINAVSTLGGLIAILLILSAPLKTLAGSGSSNWGVDTLINLPEGRSRLTVPVQANDEGDTAPIEVPCQCSDADPREQLTGDVGTTCFFHRVFNSCNNDFMFDANAELAPEGFCQMSCSRCSCCSSPADVIKSLGGNRFLQAAQATQPGLLDLLSHPGFTGTILMPTDDAFDAFLGQVGSLGQNREALLEILKFHILPPEPTRNGLWTSPFMVTGATLDTMYDGPETLTSDSFALPSGTTWRGGLTGFKINGPHNSANVIKSDEPGCKSYVTVIDSVLLPFASPPADNQFAAAAVVGANGCTVQPNALIQGSEISTITAETAGDCCSACKSTGGCNAWVYCGQKGGCRAADGSYMRSYGYCSLKKSDAVAGGNPPIFEQFSAVVVTEVSGYIGGKAPVAANAGK